ncbi:hypothetical protein [Leeuwenhoekiella nanhaiensis]|uniref:Uncharacterized protein n=1 Tax=Leeuwenhoekiella nanhaiensis TaxID=1655491 RepID=A0A2G1VN68_9FLAO|nr:hypothetical protein [Leeuwenhoekiella nanhaiensis]PHQ28050.1 hypothetical protein CJ305_16670 [Leeuwenhoekiella nanhaiensis]
MAGIVEPDLEQYFHFLIADYGFEKMKEYSLAREVFNDYFKDGTLIKFIYDGTLRVNISKAKDYNQSHNFSEKKFKKVVGMNQQISKAYLEKMYNEEGHFKEQAQLISDTFKKNTKLLESKK